MRSTPAHPAGPGGLRAITGLTTTTGLAGITGIMGTTAIASMAAMAAMAAITALAAPPAQAQTASAVPAATVRCASRNDQYEFCAVPTGRRVVLTRQLSRSTCLLGQTWGFNGMGVWVDEGCAAEFQVGGRAGTTAPRATPAPVPDRGVNPVRPVYPPGPAIYPPGPARPLPPVVTPPPGSAPIRWSSNTYIANEPGEPGQMRLTVDANGMVQGTVGGRSFTGRITDTWLQTDRAVYRLQPSGTGFLATDERDARRRIQFDVDMQRN